MKIKNKLLKQLFLSFLMLVFASCSKPANNFLTVKLNDEEVTSISMYVGQELQLDVECNNPNYTVVSSGEGLLVEYGGYLKAKSEGNYKITFTNAEIVKNIDVEVGPYIALTKMEMNKAQYSLRPGQSKVLPITYYPENASDKSFSYEVSPFDGNVYIDGNVLYVTEEASSGINYEITLTNDRSTISASFKVNVLLDKEKISWIIGDSLLDFQDNSNKEMVPCMLKELGFANNFMDNVDDATISKGHNYGLVDRIENKYYDSWAEPDLIIIQRGGKDVVDRDTLGDDVIIQSIKTTVEYFEKNYPGVRTIWSTPLYRVDASLEDLSWFRSKLHSLLTGTNIEILDIHNQNGLSELNETNYSTLLKDGIRLNAPFGTALFMEGFMNFINKKENTSKTGKIIVLFGQSNAEGYSIPSYLTADEQEKYNSVFSKTKILFDCNFSTNCSPTFINVTFGQGFPGTPERFGPEVGLAAGLAEANIDEDTYLLKYTVGGTALDNLWNPDTPGVLYTGIMNYIEQGINLLKMLGVDAKISAFCFHQGESDADGSVEKANLYEERENKLFNGIRDFCLDKNYLYDDYKFFDGTIAAITNPWIHHQIVNNAKIANALKDPNHRVVVDTNAAGLTTQNEPYNQPDICHYDASSMIKLGKLFAEAIKNSGVLNR